ncbi:hypothetical protein CCR75_007752 [Bremia lactucae]|uniref:COG4 transport protein middle alpha-helical bundle domain-containing protein n=1 Tax=Bremia lactucae TaxID=4779 RepID=A0A976FJS6_BRELC|nr:hypothetical protein CCR75_007752 [Bremia lactucae]
MAASAMSFEESVTAFFEGFAEQQLDQVCHALCDMRVSVTIVTEGDPAIFAVRNEMLRNCEVKAQSLREKAISQLTHACSGASVDVDAILCAFSQCITLGVALEAVPTFSSCLSRIFATQARASLIRVRSHKHAAKVNEHGYIDRAFYVEALSELLTGATDIMNAVADLSADTSVLQPVLEPIHASCAEIVLQVVQMYADDARMGAWERRAKVQAQRDPKQTLTGQEVEPDESLQMIDLFLDELAYLIRVLVSYTAFLGTICDTLGQQKKTESFQTKVQEWSAVYVLLERFYVFQSVHKASVLAEPQEVEHGIFVSSLVEDVSFVLNKAFSRASQCVNYHTTLSIVIALVDALESQYLPAILTLPSQPCVIPTSSIHAVSSEKREVSSRSKNHKNEVSFSDMLLQVVDNDLERSHLEEAKLIMTINSAHVSGDFVQALQGRIHEFSRISFSNDPPILESLPTPLFDLIDAFHSIVSNEVQEVLSRTLHKRLPRVLNHEMDEHLQYVLTSTQYDILSSQGSPLVKVVEQEILTNGELKRYERALCRGPFEDLVEAATQFLTKCVEMALLRSKKPCNELGALQLEREVTDMLTRMSSLVSQKSLRGAFTRLFQVAFVLNLMQPSHILDSIDKLRVDFAIDVIETLLRMRVEYTSQDIAHVMDVISKIG